MEPTANEETMALARRQGFLAGVEHAYSLIDGYVVECGLAVELGRLCDELAEELGDDLYAQE
jgi:hypothetical protein